MGKAMGMSGRNLRRYWRLLLTPLEIQRGVRDGKLPLVLGEKIEGLSTAQQAEIAERIRNGEPPKEVVSDYIQTENKRHQKPNDALASFARSLKRGMNDLDGRVDGVGPKVIREFKKTLEAAIRLIKCLLDRGNK